MKRYDSPYAFAGWAKDEDIRFNSTSGGAFSIFAIEILKQDGKIVGAKYNNKNTVEHSIVDKEDELYQIRQSKYMSSSLGNIYQVVKEYLDNGENLAFSGAPCQIAGLYSYLGRDYDNLITIDFICRGMNSPKAFTAWLNEIENIEKSNANRVWFKYKDGGWKTSPKRTRVDFDNGIYKIYMDENNTFMQGYLSDNLYIRPCCGDCKFKGVPRQSDITLADFWGIEKKYDDDKGTSLILINSDKGMELLNKVRTNMEIFEKRFEDIYEGNPMFNESVIVPACGHDFLVDLDTMSFSACLKKYSKVSMRNKIKRRIKKAIISLVSVKKNE